LNISTRISHRGLRRLLVVALTVLAVSLPTFMAPVSADAATKATSRITGFSGPASVTKGKAITLAGQVQRASGKSWIKTGTATVTVYFDADGSAPNKAVRTLKTNASGYFKTTFTASATGKWSVRLPAQGILKGSATGQKYIPVTAPPKPKPVVHPSVTGPISKWNCPAWAPIKGNAPSHIYHMPGQQFYTRTTPEACFSTEAAARNAGYRKSLR